METVDRARTEILAGMFQCLLRRCGSEATAADNRLQHTQDMKTKVDGVLNSHRRCTRVEGDRVYDMLKPAYMQRKLRSMEMAFSGGALGRAMSYDINVNSHKLSLYQSMVKDLDMH